MKKVIQIEGMSCMHCKMKVEKALNAVAGVSDVNVNLKSKDATISVDESVSDEALTKVVSDAGYQVTNIKIKKGLFR